MCECAASARFRLLHRALLALAVLASLVTAATSASAQEAVDKPQIVGLRIGFGEHYKLGCWTPAEVTLLGADRDLVGMVTLRVADGDGVPVVAPPLDSRPTQLLAGQTTTVRQLIRPGQGSVEIEVRFTYADGRRNVRKTYSSDVVTPGRSLPLPLTEGARLVAAIGPSVGVDEAATLLREHETASALETAQVSVADLPTRWFGYEGIDTLVLSTSQPEVYRQLVPGDARHQALLRWVEMGGHVVLFIGANAPEVLAPDAPLAALAPGSFVEQVSHQGFDAAEIGAALEAYSETNVPIPGLAVADATETGFEMPRLEGYAGAVELAHDELPLVIHEPRGMGVVTFVAMDFDRLPIAGWKSRGHVLTRLLAIEIPTEDDLTEDQQVGFMVYGAVDLVSLLRSGLEQFEGVRLIPFWVVALLVVVYIILIGPVDYLLVKRVLKRMELTWITFPLFVIGVSVGAYALAYWLKGDELRTNQVDVVDVDVETGFVRGTSWSNVFSPRMQRFDLSIAPQLPTGEEPAQSDSVVAWLGMPGTGFGGMGSRGAAAFGQRAYGLAPARDGLRGVPIQVWSTKTFTSRWFAYEPSPVTGELSRDARGRLQGDVTNGLDVPLLDAMIATGNRAYSLGDIAPGATATPTAQDYVRMRTWISRRAQGVDPSPHYGGVFGDWQYDIDSEDVAPVVERMMFYNAAGGNSGTNQLLNNAQHFIDMSKHLDMNRAVLLARIDRHGSELLDDQRPLAGPQDRRWTFVRFVFPVEERHEGADDDS